MSTKTSRKLTALTVFLGLIALIGTTSAIYQYNIAKNHKKAITHNYNRSLADLTDAVQDIEFSLQKGLLVSSPAQVVRLSNEINRNSNAAKANLGQLPLSGIEMDNTEKFLSQVGDYTNSLAMRISAGEEITEADYAQLMELANYCGTLSENLKKIQSSMFDGKLTLTRSNNEVKNNNSEFLDDMVSASEEDFANYPSLIYDGPFSSHIDTIEFSVLENLNEVSDKEAKEALQNFLGENNKIIRYSGEKAGKLPSYTFEIYNESSDNKNYTTAEVTKKGGKISWFLSNHSPSETKITVRDAISKAGKYLEAHGYPNMKESYYDCRNNVATINFAYMQNDIIMYPDLIKVKIAMDTGECIGIEASGFLMNNKDRSGYSPVITPMQARESVSSLAEIDSVRLSVIPTDSMSEVLCYELKGHINDNNYLVYVNAETGVQEKVLILLESENGVLTI